LVHGVTATYCSGENMERKMISLIPNKKPWGAYFTSGLDPVEKKLKDAGGNNQRAATSSGNIGVRCDESGGASHPTSMVVRQPRSCGHLGAFQPIIR
jgi:hypothetical protein